MKKFALLAVFLALPLVAPAQSVGTGLPIIACGATNIGAAYQDSSTSSVYDCQYLPTQNGYFWQGKASCYVSSGTLTCPGGGGSLPANAFGNLLNDGAGGLTWTGPSPVDVTHAGVGMNAACDGITDDSAAIQAALDKYGAVAIPVSGGGGTQCNIPEGITLCSGNGPALSFGALFGNGGFLSYSGAGSAITVGDCLPSVIEGVQIQMTAATGTPIAIDYSGCPVTSVLKDESDFATTLAAGAYTSISAIGDCGGNDTIYSVIGGGSFIVTGPTAFTVAGSGWSGNLALSDVKAFNSNGSYYTDNQSIGSTITNSNGVSFTGGEIGAGATTPAGALTVNSSQVSLTAVNMNAITATGSDDVINGDAMFRTPGIPTISGQFAGNFMGHDSSGVPYFYQNGILQNGAYYSAAGTPLPTCNSGLIGGGFGVNLWVSDATSLSGAYGVGGGTYTAPVYCGYDGTSYAWQMYAQSTGTTASGTSCAVTAITNGLITSATCTP